MKKWVLFSFFIIRCFFTNGQDYTDIVRLNVSRANFEDKGKTFDTDVTNVNFEVIYPKIINDDLILLAGLTVEHTSLDFSSVLSNQNLIMTRLNAGVKINHSEKWSGTYVVLPKLASNFENIGSRDFQIGGIALLDFQYNDNVRGKFGLYSSSENFGTIITPLLGFFYRSANKKFHMDAVLPIRLEVNYKLYNHFSLGLDLRTSVKSYNLVDQDVEFYAQEESVRVGFYGSYELFDDSLLIRAKFGLDTTDYGVYASDDTSGVQLLTFTLNNDERIRLNSEFDSALFLGLDFIYRFDISSKK